MACKKNNMVTVRIHKSFFDNVFEPERKRMQFKLGTNFTQAKFTEYLARSNAKIVLPKINNQFMPRKRKGGMLF